MVRRITTVGGGTGQYTLLRGLKNYNIELCAIVSMVDNGGNSGKLRDEFGVLPPGDLRRCLIALSRQSKILRKLFEYRLGEDCIGNMIIAALQEIVGKENYVQEAAKFLNVSGIVLPITIDEATLYAETDKKRVLRGQIEVSYNIKKGERIKRVWLKPGASIFSEAVEVLNRSDLIVICPGDLYGSILPNFLVKGAKEAILNSKAKIVYVCNLVTKQGTYQFKASDFIKEIEKYLPRKIDYLILNKQKPTQKIVDKYKGEEAAFVEPDIEKLENLERKIIKENLLLEVESDGKIIARHNPLKTAEIITKLI